GGLGGRPSGRIERRRAWARVRVSIRDGARAIVGLKIAVDRLPRTGRLGVHTRARLRRTFPPPCSRAEMWVPPRPTAPSAGTLPGLLPIPERTKIACRRSFPRFRPRRSQSQARPPPTPRE